MTLALIPFFGFSLQLFKLSLMNSVRKMEKGEVNGPLGCNVKEILIQDIEYQ